MIAHLLIAATTNGVTFLYRTIFLIAIGSTIITEIFGRRIQSELWERDCVSQNHIRPRLYGLILRLGFVVFLLVAIILMIIDQNDSFSILLIIAFGGTIFLSVDTYATKLTYNNKSFVYIRYRRKRTISWGEVKSISWEQAPRDIGLMIVICLENGEKITLRQSIFVGLRRLETMYKLK